ncbi:unnamed protein product [Gordionus sp. m RMFG-2023]|uniref:beta-galactosidase-1-like protein isoform X2 n=1 Tax=Gordionus sp. m RMFG-2023 TaxID=3053472 RepID=UPI0030DEEB87
MREFLLFVLFKVYLVQSELTPSRSFIIDYENNQFLKDGQPFRYISGTMHYFRVPNEYWEDRLLKLKYLGLDTVQTYIAWNFHETFQGVYNFTGDHDIFKFLETAQKVGLNVILRPGPYIDAEWDFVENEYGSYFACDMVYLQTLVNLLKEHLGEDIFLFTTDGNGLGYLKCGKIPGVYATIDFGSGSDVEASFKVQRQVEPKGPLINSEYYTGWIDHWGYPHSLVDHARVTKTLKAMLDSANSTCVNLYVVEGGTSFAFYNGANINYSGKKENIRFGMIEYMPSPTSYDFDAPITEGGDLTPKYWAIRDVIGQYKKLPTGGPPQSSREGKVGYGTITLYPVNNVISLLSDKNYFPNGAQNFKSPPSFEKLDHPWGFVLYKHSWTHADAINVEFISNAVIDTSHEENKFLRYRHRLRDDKNYTLAFKAAGLYDRAQVMIDGIVVGIMDRMSNSYTLEYITDEWPFPVNTNIHILVENQGRICYGPFMNDSKGLESFSINGDKLVDWVTYPLEFDQLTKTITDKVTLENNSTNNLFHGDIEFISNHPNSTPNKSKGLILGKSKERKYFENEQKDTTGNTCPPTFYAAHFHLPPSIGDTPNDTYLDLKNWNKGQVFLNNHNLGRYWTNKGPQRTLYVPGIYLQPYPKSNVLIIFELEAKPPCEFPSQSAKFVDKPVILKTQQYYGPPKTLPSFSIKHLLSASFWASLFNKMRFFAKLLYSFLYNYI